MEYVYVVDDKLNNVMLAAFDWEQGAKQYCNDLQMRYSYICLPIHKKSDTVYKEEEFASCTSDDIAYQELVMKYVIK